MSTDNKALQGQISNLENISLDEKGMAALKNADNVFCTSWPIAKTVLESIREMVKNPFVKAAINTVIALGDGLYKKNCPAGK